MPPKKQAQAGGSKKAEQKKKEKIIEDKTFGLKNKKGAKQQKFIKAVTHQVKFGQQNPRQVDKISAFSSYGCNNSLLHMKSIWYCNRISNWNPTLQTFLYLAFVTQQYLLDGISPATLL